MKTKNGIISDEQVMNDMFSAINNIKIVALRKMTMK